MQVREREEVKSVRDGEREGSGEGGEENTKK